jgi:hypothetical protein
MRDAGLIGVASRNHFAIGKGMPRKRAPWIARILFRHAYPHHQRQSLRQLTMALLIGVIVAGTVGVMIYRQAAAQVH